MIGGKIIIWGGSKFVTHCFDEDKMDKCLLCGRSIVHIEYKKMGGCEVGSALATDVACKELDTAMSMWKSRKKII